MAKCKGKSERIREEGKIVTALAFMVELIACHLRLKLKENHEANLTKKNYF